MLLNGFGVWSSPPNVMPFGDESVDLLVSRTNLERCKANIWMLGQQLSGMVHVTGFEREKAAQLLLGFGDGTIRGHHLAIFDGSVLAVLALFRGLSAEDELLAVCVVGEVVAGERVLIGVVEVDAVGAIIVDVVGLERIARDVDEGHPESVIAEIKRSAQAGPDVVARDRVAGRPAVDLDAGVVARDRGESHRIGGCPVGDVHTDIVAINLVRCVHDGVAGGMKPIKSPLSTLSDVPASVIRTPLLALAEMTSLKISLLVAPDRMATPEDSLGRADEPLPLVPMKSFCTQLP